MRHVDAIPVSNTGITLTKCYNVHHVSLYITHHTLHHMPQPEMFLSRDKNRDGIDIPKAPEENANVHCTCSS